jgi:hypothetical protein
MMDIGELQDKYKHTGLTAISAMMILENSKKPNRFLLMLDPAQRLDWQESMMSIIEDTPTP